MHGMDEGCMNVTDLLGYLHLGVPEMLPCQFLRIRVESRFFDGEFFVGSFRHCAGQKETSTKKTSSSKNEPVMTEQPSELKLHAVNAAFKGKIA